jgi:hypothetical protein
MPPAWRATLGISLRNQLFEKPDFNKHDTMKRSFILLLALFVMTSVTFAADRTNDRRGGDYTVKKTFNVRPGGTLFLDIDRGSIEVRTISGNQVHIEMDRRIRGVDDKDIKEFLERHNYELRQDGNDIIIDSKFDDDEQKSWGNSRRHNDEQFRMRLTVLVPERFNLDFLSGAGNVEIEDLDGFVTGRTGAGNIEIGDISGSVDLMSGAGFINIDSVAGVADVLSGAGNITIGELGGNITAQTGAGNIEVTITEQPRGDSKLTSGAGTVTVYMDDNIAVDVEARSSLGSADSAFGHKVNGKWMSKSFEGRVNGGGPALVMHSGVGSVSLRKN